MPKELDLTFRGEEMTVVVDSYQYDSDTNSLEVEWHFKDLTPEQHNALNITTAEETRIIEEISEWKADEYERDLPDEYDYRNDR